MIDAAHVASIKPETALEYLENCEWYFYGGSYYGAGVSVGIGEINI